MMESISICYMKVARTILRKLWIKLKQKYEITRRKENDFLAGKEGAKDDVSLCFVINLTKKTIIC